jgi:uncharacterized repeat protein (TIGR03987 family)
MPPLLRFALSFIVLALVLYTVGVWGERLSGRLKLRHLIVMWAGLTADVVATALMARLSGGFHLSLHSFAGVLGILLMALQTVWGTIALARRDEAAMTRFHKMGIYIWMIWLVAFVSGAILSSMR